MIATRARRYLFVLCIGLSVLPMAQGHTGTDAGSDKETDELQLAALDQEPQAAVESAQNPQARERRPRRGRWQDIPEPERRVLRDGARNYRDLPPRQRRLMRQSMAVVSRLPTHEQRRLRKIWRNLSPRERRRWLERGGPGISPPPALSPRQRE